MNFQVKITLSAALLNWIYMNCNIKLLCLDCVNKIWKYLQNKLMKIKLSWCCCCWCGCWVLLSFFYYFFFKFNEVNALRWLLFVSVKSALLFYFESVCIGINTHCVLRQSIMWFSGISFTHEIVRNIIIFSYK